MSGRITILSTRAAVCAGISGCLQAPGCPGRELAKHRSALYGVRPDRRAVTEGAAGFSRDSAKVNRHKQDRDGDVGILLIFLAALDGLDVHSVCSD